MPIDFVDERNARLGMAVRAGHNSVPDVGSIRHAGSRRLFNQSVRKIGGFKCFFVAESHGRAIGPPIDNIVAPRDWIESRLRPQGELVLIELEVPFLGQLPDHVPVEALSVVPADSWPTSFCFWAGSQPRTWMVDTCCAELSLG